MDIKTDQFLDAKELACPMPIVKTKKAMKDLKAGEVLEVQATDPGSKADIQAWARSAGHHYLGIKEENGLLRHFLRKAIDEEVKDHKHPHIVSNEELQKVLADPDTQVIDVRESAEYIFEHIPGSLSIPLGEIKDRTNELKQDKNLFVICRTGNRSDLAAQQLSESGYQKVYNVVPGMIEWSGEKTSK